MTMTGCILDQITPDAWRLVEAMEDADHGNLPLAGGTLDQTEVFAQGLRWARRLEDRCKAAHAAG